MTAICRFGHFYLLVSVLVDIDRLVTSAHVRKFFYHALSISRDSTGAIKHLKFFTRICWPLLHNNIYFFLTCHSRLGPLASLQLRVYWPILHLGWFYVGPYICKDHVCRDSGRGYPSHRLLWPSRGCARSKRLKVLSNKNSCRFLREDNSAFLFANMKSGENRYITGNRTQPSTLFLVEDR